MTWTCAYCALELSCAPGFELQHMCCGVYSRLCAECLQRPGWCAKSVQDRRAYLRGKHQCRA